MALWPLRQRFALPPPHRYATGRNERQLSAGEPRANQINARYSPNALVAVNTTPTITSITFGEKRLAI